MKNLNVPLPDELLEQLDDFAKTNGINKKKIVEVALIKYLKENKEVL